MKTNKTGKIFIGKVVSDKMNNTIVLEMSYTKRHPIYKKLLPNTKKFMLTIIYLPKQAILLKLGKLNPLASSKDLLL
jgi:hypothetical protein